MHYILGVIHETPNTHTIDLTIEILDQAHKLNKPTRAINCLNTQNTSRSINSHNMNKLQSSLQQLDIENP